MIMLSKCVRVFNHVVASSGPFGSTVVSRSLSGGIGRFSNAEDVHKGNAVLQNISFTPKFLGCHTICANRNSSPVIVPPAARGIVIGKIYNWVNDLSVENVNSVLESFNNSAAVTCIRDVFLWTDSTFGLPWWMNIVLTTVALRAVLYIPAAAYMEHWGSRRELYMLDSIPINSRLRTASGKRERVRELIRARRQILKEYNCQNYKFFLALIWQISNMILMSAGLRQCLLTYGGSGLRNASLPWGSELGFPDGLLILPLLNIALNIMMIEVDAWRLSAKNTELQMTLKRGSLESQTKHMIRSQKFGLHVKRASCVLLLVIYISVPSALTLLWAVMLTHTLGFRLALLHPQVRRLFGISKRCYETSEPHRDFLLYLGRHLQKKSLPK